MLKHLSIARIFIVVVTISTVCTISYFINKEDKGSRSISSITEESCLSSIGNLVRHDDDSFDLTTLNQLYNPGNEQNYARFLKFIDNNFSLELRRKIGGLARKINSFHEERIFVNFFLELQKAKLLRPRKSVTNPEWAKGTWSYLYVDKYGADKNGTATFKNLAKNLEYLKNDLGIDNLYLLPINKSPRMDGGYDVASYKLIDPSLGGNLEFKKFMSKARRLNMNVMIDFVPGHTSIEHEWFKKALNGDSKYINYYINSANEKQFTTRVRNGNSYNVYTTNDGAEYERLLLFPDIESKHWNKHSVKNRDHYFYSSFYPFQKDLNMQNPDVLQEHLSTLGFWISEGVRGIRADAISWWVKKEGTSGQHLDETFAVAEYFFSFLRHLDDQALFLPELVDSHEMALKYIGGENFINGTKTGRNANAVFDFEKSVQILYAGISGDFSAHYNFLSRTRNNPLPDTVTSILYANHHDEIYLGFLPENARRNFADRINNTGGIVYKGGNSAGAMVADLLDNNPDQMIEFYKFMFAHKGSLAIFQGLEIGAGNAWKESYLTTFDQLEEFVKNGKLQRNDPVFDEVKAIKNNPSLMSKHPGSDSLLLKYMDGRLLHRNIISQKSIEQAKDGGNHFFDSFSDLIAKRKNAKALSDGGTEEPLDTLRSDIGSFMRRYRNSTGKVLEEVAVIKNGTETETIVNLNLSQLTSHKNFSLFEIEKEMDYPYRQLEDRRSIQVKIEPYQTLWLKVVKE